MAVWSKEYIQVHGGRSQTHPDKWPGVTHHPDDPPITINLSIDSITRSGSNISAVVSGGLNQSKTIGYYRTDDEQEWGYADDFYIGAAIIPGAYSDVSSLSYVSSSSSAVTTVLSKPYSSADASGWSNTKYTFTSKTVSGSSIASTGTLVIYFRSGSNCEGCSSATGVPKSDLSSRWYPVEAYVISNILPPSTTTYTITFHTNNTDIVSPITVDSGTAVNLPSYTGTKSVTLTYNPNGGSVSPTSKSISLSKDYWYTASSGGTKVSSPYTVTGNIDLYVHWLPTAVGSLATPSPQSSSYKLQDTSKPWTTTLNGTTFVDSTYTISSNTTIYAKWMYLVTVNLNGGYRSIDTSTVSSDNLTVWKVHNTSVQLSAQSSSVTINGSEYSVFKQGGSLLGLNTSSSATSGQSSITYTSNSPVTYYLIWTSQTFTVTFKDGYHAEGQNVIEIVRSIPYGGKISDGYYTKSGMNFSGTIPVIGQNYGNITFSKKPGLYALSGWTGGFSASTKVYSDMIVEATWDFSPIWVKNSAGNWVPYKPVEN